MAIACRGAAVLALAAVAGVLSPATAAATRGVMITIHGGAWISSGAQAMRAEAPDAARYAAQGWLVDNIDYRPGRYALRDTLAAYDSLRRAHPRLPICASGESSGGHLALMLAARRPGLACAISKAGPTDLVHFPAGYLADVIHQYLAPYLSLRHWSRA